jgi:hypothetical protein
MVSIRVKWVETLMRTARSAFVRLGDSYANADINAAATAITKAPSQATER